MFVMFGVERAVKKQKDLLPHEPIKENFQIRLRFSLWYQTLKTDYSVMLFLWLFRLFVLFFFELLFVLIINVLFLIINGFVRGLF